MTSQERENRLVLRVALLVAVAIAAFHLGTQAARGQTIGGNGHGHPVADEALHEKFYSTWYMPDNPAASCCNKADCYPTEVQMRNGRIFAQRREDGKFIPIPDAKIERNRDNPDGRNHMCAPPPSAGSYPADHVFCFTLGGGT